jgi:hypothetical protein
MQTNVLVINAFMGDAIRMGDAGDGALRVEVAA